MIATDNSASCVDVFIVGAGFGGICQAHALLDSGLSMKIIDALPDVGGTWLRNTYPGATSDVEGFAYRFSFDKEDVLAHPWRNRYLSQAEILAYLRRFVDKHQLRQYMQFNTTLKSAAWNEDAQVWDISLSTGETYNARYFVPALGVLSSSNVPDLPGISDFQGPVVHSSHWPKDLDVAGKRVGVFGCGSSGVQIITNVAPSARSLTAFIRNPQYVLPSRERQLDQDFWDWLGENYEGFWDQLKSSRFGCGFVESNRPFFSTDPARRQQLLQEAWDAGNGSRFLGENFCDLLLDREANAAVCEFIRRKIEDTVRNPDTVAKLIPRELFARRPVQADGYYETFNRDNVSVVSLLDTPVEHVTANGVRTADGVLHELDVIVLATGFDAFEGSLTRVNIAGRNGQLLKDVWKDGPRCYLGSFASGFPNMMMVNGPLGAFGNVVAAIEASVEFITHAILRAEVATKEHGRQAIIEATAMAEDEWVQTCAGIVKMTVLDGEVKSWLNGGNITGKPVGVRFYLGGLGTYRATGIEATQDSWTGFKPLVD